MILDMLSRWNTFEDDRGTHRSVCLVSDSEKISKLTDSHVLGNDRFGRFLPTFVWSNLFFALIVLSILLSGRNGQVFPWMSVVLFILLSVVLSTVSGMIAKRQGWSSFSVRKETSLAVGCCPSCGYSISEISPQDDGCTICPECGAAWRLGV